MVGRAQEDLELAAGQRLSDVFDHYATAAPADCLC